MKIDITLDKKGLAEAATKFVEGLLASPKWHVAQTKTEYDSITVTISDEPKETSSGN